MVHSVKSIVVLSRGRLKGAVIALLFDLLQHFMSHFRVVLWANWLIHELVVFLPHGEKSSPIFPGLHALVKIWFDDALSLAGILGSLLVACLFQVLIDRLSVVLLLLIVLVDNLLGRFNRCQGVSIDCVCLLKRALNFHVDLIIVGKELLRKGLLLGGSHF